MAGDVWRRGARQPAWVGGGKVSELGREEGGQVGERCAGWSGVVVGERLRRGSECVRDGWAETSMRDTIVLSAHCKR